jgi:hypothetical protein
MWRRGLKHQLPAFLFFSLLTSIGQLGVYAADIAPSVTAADFWRVVWVSLSLASLLKFLAIGEVFSRVFNPYPSVSKLGKYVVSAVGAMLIFIAAFVAAISPGDNTIRLLSGAHLLELTVFMVESGLIVLIFLIAAYFRMPWDRFSLGILLGFGVSSCVNLATWAVMTNMGVSSHGRTLFDFANMGVYHLAVLIWCYTLLVPRKKRPPNPPNDRSSGTPLSGPEEQEEALNDWNRELERLIHQ